MAKSKKLIIDYNKLRSLVRLNCPDSVILKAILLEQQSTGDELVDDLLGSFVIYKEFDNWGGSRIGSGRKSKPNQDDFQLENQDDKIKMIKSRCNQDVDKDKDINNNKNKIIDIYTRFNAGFQNWKFEPAILKVAKKHWTAESIRNIEREFSCKEFNTETTLADLLEQYPSDKVPFKILGEKQTIALTKKQWDWFQSQGIAPAVKIKAIDLLEDYSFSNPKRFKEYTDLSIIIGRSTGWAYKEAFKDPYVFENQEHLIAELKRVGLK